SGVAAEPRGVRATGVVQLLSRRAGDRPVHGWRMLEEVSSTSRRGCWWARVSQATRTEIACVGTALEQVCLIVETRCPPNLPHVNGARCEWRTPRFVGVRVRREAIAAMPEIVTDCIDLEFRSFGRRLWAIRTPH